MTNSPAMRKAEGWTQSQFSQWGLRNVHKEGFEFGRGWWIESASTRMIAPRPIMLRSIPVAWTPPTAGALTAPIIVAPMRRMRDLAAWHGKLAGKDRVGQSADRPQGRDQRAIHPDERCRHQEI